MTFADLAAGDSVFVDANTLLLLTNDAAVVVIMQSSGLTKIASNDPDFDRVPGLTRYAPA